MGGQLGLSMMLQTGGPPGNIPFLVAAFAVTGVALLAYGVYVFRRRREAEREARGLEGGEGRGQGPGQ